MWLQPGIKLQPTYVLPDLLTFLVNLPLSKSGYIISHRSPLHKGLFWPSIPLVECHSNLSPLSLFPGIWGWHCCSCSIFIVATGPVYCARHTRFVCGWFCPDLVLFTEVARSAKPRLNFVVHGSGPWISYGPYIEIG